MPIASPCIKLCILDPISGLCEGCGRTIAEIGGWSSLTEAERLRIMATLPSRLVGATSCDSITAQRLGHEAAGSD